MVCLRGEVLVLLVSVRLAAVASLSPERLAGWQNLNSFACEACLCSRVCTGFAIEACLCGRI